MCPTSKTQDRYQRALQECAKVAREEHEVAVSALREAGKLAEKLRLDVAQVVTHRRREGAAVEDAHQRLCELQSKLEETISSSLSSTQEALAEKRRSLDRFTVTLFGRTMAGKSTIREALTHGDGSTIGKGAQRTTRDIREYEWNSLRIVDTPGIGAYDGTADRELALSVVDQSDIILFLASSDGIQEESFRGMQALRGQNKPVIFVLNVKRDLEKQVFLRRFLRDAGTVFNKEELDGHFSRLRTLAGEFLGMRDIRVVPIHAQAAFLATRSEHGDNAAVMHEHSRVDDLLDAIEAEVQRKGTVRRLQTILDGTLNALVDLHEQLREQAKTIRRGASYLKDKFGELDSWLDGFIRSTNARAESEAARLVLPLKNGVSAFVDENIECEDVVKRWHRKVKALNIESWIERQQAIILDELRGRMNEFAREMAVESNLIAAFETSGPKTYDPWDVKRTMRWVSAGGAALAGVAAVAAWISTTNFWNPVGWVAGAVSLVALGLSWLFGDREKKIQRQKAKAAAQLRGQIDDLERNVAGCLKNWFDEHVTSRLVRGIRVDTKQLYNGMYNIAWALDDGGRQVELLIERLNRRLLIRTGCFLGVTVAEDAVQRVVRDPGVRSKLLWSDGEDYTDFCRTVGKAIGEWVDGVPAGSQQSKIAGALKPANVLPPMVKISNMGAEVRLPGGEVGRAIGRGGSNVSLASRLVQMKIRIMAQGE